MGAPRGLARRTNSRTEAAVTAAEWGPDSLELVLDSLVPEPRSATVRRTRALARMLRTRRTEVTLTTPRLRPPDPHLVGPRGVRLLPRRTSRTCTTAGACRARAMLLPARANTVTRRLTTRARTEEATLTLSSSTTLNNNSRKLRTDNRARLCSTPVRRPTRLSSRNNNCTRRRRPTRVGSLITTISRWARTRTSRKNTCEDLPRRRRSSPVRSVRLRLLIARSRNSERCSSSSNNRRCRCLVLERPSTAASSR